MTANPDTSILPAVPAGDAVDREAAAPTSDDAASTSTLDPRSSNPPAPPTTVIRPPKGWQPIDLPELWRYRELFLIFALRDIKVRYKQTVLGVGWALIQPIAFTIVGMTIFRGVAGAGNDNVAPAFLFYFASQIPWMLFNTGLQTSAISLVGAQNMIKKVYFPRLVLPTSAVMVSLVDMLIQSAILLAVVLALPLIAVLFPGSGIEVYTPPWQIVFAPVAVLWAFLSALSIGLPLSALNVEFRDVRYVIPFVTQFMIFAAPVFWPASGIESGTWRAVYGLLPVAGPIEFFRWCLFDSVPAHLGLWAVGAASTAVWLLLGLAYFRKMEDSFADVV